MWKPYWLIKYQYRKQKLDEILENHGDMVSTIETLEDETSILLGLSEPESYKIIGKAAGSFWFDPRAMQKELEIEQDEAFSQGFLFKKCLKNGRQLWVRDKNAPVAPQSTI